MERVLKIAKDLSLPLDVITDKAAFLGQSGSGKTFGAMHLAELMLDVGAQIVALDPAGVWWGLSSSADGKSAGYPITIMGGKRGHIPLDPKAGKLVAEFICTSRTSVILDVSDWTLSQQAHFISEFSEAFWHLQKADARPIHLFIEEAHAFIPQQIPAEAKEAAIMLGRMRRLVKVGRNNGIGCTMISQEPQSIDKRCLNLTAVLFAGRLMGDLERKAIERWFGDNARDKSDFDILKELPNLDTGEAFVCSPHLLKLFRKVKIGEKKTFDSSATPKFGQRILEPKAVAKVDIDALRDRMKEMVSQVEADDPRALRRKIAELEAQSRKVTPAAKAAPAAVIKQRVVEVGVLGKRDSARLNKLVASVEWVKEEAIRASQMSAKVHARATDLLTATMELRSACLKMDGAKGVGGSKVVEVGGFAGPMPITWDPSLPMTSYRDANGKVHSVLDAAKPQRDQLSFGPGLSPGPGLTFRNDGIAAASPHRPPAQNRDSAPAAAEPAGLRKGERRMLEVLARSHPAKRTWAQIGTLAGFTPSGGTFQAYRGTLRRQGLVVEQGDMVSISALGMQQVGGAPAAPQSTEEVLETWRRALRSGERKMLDALVQRYPNAITKGDLGTETGFTAAGGTFQAYLGTLRRNGLIETNGDQVRASEALLLGSPA